MLDFLETYGVDILALITAAAGCLTSIWSFIKSLRLNKSVQLTQDTTMQQIEITQAGIVEAFKKAKIPTEWKISISQQVDKKLEDWAAKIMTLLSEHEELRTQLALANAKILKYTAAFNKLTEDEKAEIDDLVKEITDKDKVIEV